MEGIGYPQMALTVVEIGALPAKATSYKAADENGLYLLINPSATKLWKFKFKFRFRGAEKKLSFGQFPDVPLKAARIKCEDARWQLANGIDPADAKRKAAIEAVLSKANTFRLVPTNVSKRWRRRARLQPPPSNRSGFEICSTATSDIAR